MRLFDVCSRYLEQNPYSIKFIKNYIICSIYKNKKLYNIGEDPEHLEQNCKKWLNKAKILCSGSVRDILNILNKIGVPPSKNGFVKPKFNVRDVAYILNKPILRKNL